jgi:hypothetical protein
MKFLVEIDDYAVDDALEETDWDGGMLEPEELIREAIADYSGLRAGQIYVEVMK